MLQSKQVFFFFKKKKCQGKNISFLSQYDIRRSHGGFPGFSALTYVSSWQIADELTQTQGKVSATEDKVRELNEKFEPVEVNSVYVIAKVGTIYLVFIWRTLVANFRQKKALYSDPLVVQIKKTMQGNAVDSIENSLVKALRAVLLQMLFVTRVEPNAPIRIH